MYIYIYIYSEVMRTIQCAHPSHHHDGLLLVLEPTECSKSTKRLSEERKKGKNRKQKNRKKGKKKNSQNQWID